MREGRGLRPAARWRLERRAPPVVLRLLGEVIISIGIGASLGCGGSDGQLRAPPPVEVDKPAPAYRSVTASGDSVSLEGLRGKPVLLNVWATWCHPCRDEIPELQRLYERYRGRGLELVGVSVDAVGDEEAINAFARRYGMTYPIWRDPNENVSTSFLVVGVPATFLIDRSGVLRWKKTGPIDRGDTALTAAIERALGAGT